MTFKVQTLAGQAAVISGTDINGITGQCVVSTYQWDHLKKDLAVRAAHEEFDAAASEFYAPLEAATDALIEAQKQHNADTIDPAFEIVLEEGTEAVAATRRKAIKLDRDTVLLRLIDDGQGDRLIWVNDCLEILAETPAYPVPSFGLVPDDGDNE